MWELGNDSISLLKRAQGDKNFKSTSIRLAQSNRIWNIQSLSDVKPSCSFVKNNFIAFPDVLIRLNEVEGLCHHYTGVTGHTKYVFKNNSRSRCRLQPTLLRSMQTKQKEQCLYNQFRFQGNFSYACLECACHFVALRFYSHYCSVFNGLVLPERPVHNASDSFTLCRAVSNS